MSTYDCKTIQREIDEANLDARLTVEVSEHLSRCDKCRRFHDERRTLRGLMAELETVGAPADFDFRLRARLARERPINGFGRLHLTAGPIAAVALVVLIAAVAVVVKSRMSTGSRVPGRETTASKHDPVPTPLATTTPSEGSIEHKETIADNGPNDSGVHFKANPVTERNRTVNTNKKRATNVAVGNTQRFSVLESAGTGADMITPGSFSSLVVVPVDARTFKLSIDNGRGVARTISLPPVSFGSQRLLAREASFVPVSSARGDW